MPRSRAIFALLLAVGLAAPAGAVDGALRGLVTADEGRGWEAVGRIDIGAGGFCTGTLISEEIVLTAAHCLFDEASGDPLPVGAFRFLAGWRGGQAAAYRGVRRAIPHPDFVLDPGAGRISVTNDIAILQLDQPIRNSAIQPMPTGARPRKGTEVGVVSYAHDRAEAPSLQEVCHVLARQAGSLVLSCSVDFGSSGAPIFTTVNGYPEIVSVVSAKAMVGDRRVSLGTALDAPLAELRAELRENDVFGRTPEEPRRLQAGAAREETGGAKFLRP